MQSTCRYLYILIFSAFVLLPSSLFAQADSTAKDTTGSKEPRKELPGHQLNLGMDFFHPLLNSFYNDRPGYEILADYYFKNEYFLVAEGGWGGSFVNYSDLQYKTTNSFFRFGFNKSVLIRDRPNDWDMMFIGLRAAYSEVKKTPSTYQVIDSLWGSGTGSDGAKNFHTIWAEITGGVRVEVVKGLSLGWNIRGKFAMNWRAYKNFAPLYIAGYGRGDKNAVFDFNMYISYAIRWKRKHAVVAK